MARTKRKVSKPSPRARPYREVDKPFGIRTTEFVQALQLISDSLKRIREGQHRHLASLSGQLRALLIEKSKGVQPLLLEMAQKLQKELRVYCMPGVNDPSMPPQLKDNMLLRVSGFPITSERQFQAQLEVDFPELIDHEILTFKGNNYSAESVIEWYANKAGGVHYSTRLPEDFAALMSGGPFNIQPLASILMQIGEATLLGGRQLLKSLVDLDLHALVVVPAQDASGIADPNYLLDSQYEGSSMRLSLFLNKRLMPSFIACGLDGNWARVDSDRLIDWSEPRHLHASLRIEDDLATVMELAVDGVRVGRLRFEGPLFVLSDPLDYESFQNKSCNGPPQRFSFGLGEVLAYGKEMSPIDAAKLLIYFHDKLRNPDLPLCFFLPEAYGHAPRGTKNFQMTGSVRKETARRVLGRE
jgi:hypothetical protein